MSPDALQCDFTYSDCIPDLFPESNRYYNDDFCLLQLLNAMCLKHMSSPLQAEESLKAVISFSGQLKADTYLIPYALFEYAMLLKEQGMTDAAMEHLESAK